MTIYKRSKFEINASQGAHSKIVGSVSFADLLLEDVGNALLIRMQFSLLVLNLLDEQLSGGVSCMPLLQRTQITITILRSAKADQFLLPAALTRIDDCSLQTSNSHSCMRNVQQ